MRAIDYLKKLPYLPASVERGKLGRPSNSELGRWLDNKSVIINGQTPRRTDEVVFPIESLIFFPRSKRKTTLWN